MPDSTNGTSRSNLHPIFAQALKPFGPLNPNGSHWVSDDSVASAQIEHDQNPTAPTSTEIYCMCMESDMADQHARWLCKMAGVAFPPEANK